MPCREGRLNFQYSDLTGQQHMWLINELPLLFGQVNSGRRFSTTRLVSRAVVLAAGAKAAIIRRIGSPPQHGSHYLALPHGRARLDTVTPSDAASLAEWLGHLGHVLSQPVANPAD